MGTRNLTCVFLDGEYKVAQYGQWDGYPSGQGLTCLEFLRSMDEGTFKDQLRKRTFASNDYIKGFYAAINAIYRMISMQTALRMDVKFPEYSRDTAAEILELIYDDKAAECLKNDIDFAATAKGDGE